MIKYLFIIVNSLAVFFYSLFSGDNGVTVTSNIPATMKAGQETTIELKITKGGMNGFAKLTMELPEGMAAKESENKGANYTFSKGIAKWVWASLPPENEIIIKVTLISAADAKGSKSISAKFSFVENNAKQVVEMTPAELTIQPSDGTEAVTTTAPVTTENPPAAAPENPPAVAATTPETPAAAPANASNSEPPGNVSVTRTLTKMSENEYLVRLEIKKGSTKGFARYSDDLQEGINIKALKTDGSSFSIGDGKLKFVWVAVPDKEVLELEYTMSASSSMQAVLNGEYSYLEDSQSKKQIVTSEAVALSGQTSAPSEPVTITEKETKAAEPPASKPETTENRMRESMAKKEGNVNYNVQIGAFTNASVTADRLKKVFHVTESI